MSHPPHTPRLLPAAAVQPTGPVDHPDWNYRPVLGRVQRLRFRMVVDLLGGDRFGRILEIGYGSGVFQPELARWCRELHGIDAHPLTGEVAGRLAQHGVTTTLTRGSAEALPYDDGFFDCVVAVSTLEYVESIDTACREIDRVLAPGGSLIVVTPGASALWSPVLAVATRQGASQYGDRRQRLQPALYRHFRPEREVRVPRFGGSVLRLYTGLRLRAGGTAA
ncbi:class I SAM-dependent methyltransferase [Polymorphospora sp. NPDC050346]|uniref:class I SAM-dependent methyltransferase n=1 Tax=Polymorphospora sp. NPDC050346 TaxID=3155780 RepID=UPI0033F6D698